MAEIVVSEFMDEAALAGLAGEFEVLADPGLVDRSDALIEAVSTARALIVRNRTQVRGALLDAAARLEVVGRLGVGLDNIDLDTCATRGIEVCPARGANDLSVAEYVITSALMLLRGAYTARDAMLQGEWPRNALMGRELAGRTMGLVGFGSIARKVASRAQALGMNVQAFDPYIETGDPIWGETRNVTFEALLTSSDIVSLHVPLTDGTRHLIDRGALDAMRDDAILINAARGGTVDEDALCDALRRGSIGGAALDVFGTEPLTAAAAQKYRGLANLILTPHIAGVTIESNVRVSKVVATAVAEVLRHRG